MDMNEIRDTAIKNAREISALQGWRSEMDRRVDALERGQSMLHQVELALTKLTETTRHFGEKLNDMKEAIEQISAENKAQHAAMNERIKKIEDAPGDKWNKVSIAVITTIIGGVIGYLVNNLLK